MFKNITKGLAVSLLVLMMVPIVVRAQEDSTATTQNNIEQTTETEEATTESRNAQREAKIQALKDKAQTKLTKAEERSISSKCSAAQKIVEKLQSKLNGVVEARREKYSGLVTNLTELSTKLQLAGADTTELEVTITEIENLITDSLDKIDAYNEVLANLATVNCASDPEAFKLLLEEARSNRTEILGMQGTLKSTINETIKPVLQQIRESLESENTNGEGEQQ